MKQHKPHAALIESVKLYLVAKTFAELQRERVNKIFEQLLQEIPLFDDLNSRTNGEKKRILEYRHTYATQDEEGFKLLLARANEIEREQGIKPAEMEDDFCPALVAEHLQTKAANVVIDEIGILLNQGLNYSRKVNYPNFSKMVDLGVKFVLSYLEDIGTPLDSKQVHNSFAS